MKPSLQFDLFLDLRGGIRAAIIGVTVCIVSLLAGTGASAQESARVGAVTNTIKAYGPVLSGGERSGAEQPSATAGKVAAAGYPLVLGSSGSERIHAAVTDAAGNTYVTGDFTGTFDLDPGANFIPVSSEGGTDLFVAMYDANGALRWGYSTGGALNELGTGIAVADGRVFLGGNFYGGLNLGPAGTIFSSGDADGYILAIDAATAALLWVSKFGGTKADGNPRLAVADGRVYALARFIGPADFDDGPGAAILDGAGSYDAALVAFDAVTGAHVWSRSILGTTGQDFEGGVDADDFVYATANNMANSTGSGVVGKYALDTGNLQFETAIADAAPYDVKLAGDRVLVAGGTWTQDAGLDVWVAAYDASAGGELWAKTVGGPGNDLALGVDVLDGDVYVGGNFEQTADFDPGAGTEARTSAGGADAFVARYAMDSGAFLQAEAFGGTGYDSANSVEGGATIGLVAGAFSETADLEPESDQTSMQTSAGGTDAFVSFFEPADGPVSTEELVPETGLAVDIYPNPASDAATISVMASASVAATGVPASSIIAYDILGREVLRLHDGPLQVGEQQLALDASGLAVGVYLVRVSVGEVVETRRLVVVR